jgi:rubrerythrin
VAEEETMAVEWNLADFKVEDLLSMAVVMEQKGYDFYSAVIEKSPERRVKNEIRFLREEEARHKTRPSTRFCSGSSSTRSRSCSHRKKSNRTATP